MTDSVSTSDKNPTSLQSNADEQGLDYVESHDDGERHSQMADGNALTDSGFDRNPVEAREPVLFPISAWLRRFSPRASTHNVSRVRLIDTKPGRRAFLLWNRIYVFFWALWEIRNGDGRRQVALMKLGRLVGRSPDPQPICLRMRALQGRQLWIRPGASDLEMAYLNLHGRIVFPPPDVQASATMQIVELGSNSGSGLAGLAVEFPEARLLGVEPDPETAAIARRSVEQFGDRCTLVEAAIWDSATDLVIEGDEALGFTVRPRTPSDPTSVETIRGISVQDLLDEHMPDGPIDFMAVTIEGTEPRMLATAESWIHRVRCIKVEFHPYYGWTEEDCLATLRGFGFSAWTDPRYGGWGLGVRR